MDQKSLQGDKISDQVLESYKKYCGSPKEGVNNSCWRDQRHHRRCPIYLGLEEVKAHLLEMSSGHSRICKGKKI